MEANIIGRGDDSSTESGILCPLLRPPDPPFCQYPSQWIDVTVVQHNAAADQDLAGFSLSKTLLAEGSDRSSTLSRCGSSPSPYSSSHPSSADLFRVTEHTHRMKLLCHEVREIPKHFALIQDTVTTFYTEGSSLLGGDSMNEKVASNLIEIQSSTPDSMKISLEDDAGCNYDKMEDARIQEMNRCDSGSGRSSMIRNCFHCGTTKTPLWRSGPEGPKSLCNACGIRFKKSRKYIGGFQSSDIPGPPNSNKPPHKRKQESIGTNSQSSRQQEDKSAAAVRRQATPCHRSTGRWTLPLKGYEKQDQETTGSAVGSCITWNLKSPTSLMTRKGLMKGRKGERPRSSSTGAHKHGSITRVFAKDEEEAAVLLMALSCGLVNA